MCRLLGAFMLLGVVHAATAAVEPRLLSAWRATISNATGTWILQFRPEFDGRYRTRFSGPAPVPDETGLLEAIDGRWSVLKDDGRTDGGTYVFATDDVVTFTGRDGTVVWQRESSLPPVPGAPAAAIPGAGPVPPSPPGLPPAAGAPPGDWPPGDLPAQAAALLDRAREWRTDAVLEGIETDLLGSGSAVVSNLDTAAGRATLKFIYCSPADRRRLVISPGMAFGETFEAESPRCDGARTPPPDFMDLPEAVRRARGRGLVDGDPRSASLGYVTGVEGEEPSGWMWRIHPPRYSNDPVYEIPVTSRTGAAARQVDACALLTAEDAAGLIGAVQSIDPGYLVAGTWGCTWQASGDAGRRVSLVVDQDPHRDAGAYLDRQARGGRTPVEGLGDRAVLFDSPAGAAFLDILVGETLLQLTLGREEAGRDPAIRDLGRAVTERFNAGIGVTVTASPLHVLRGRWRTTVGGDRLALTVDEFDAFTLVADDGATTLGSGSIRHQDRRARIIFDPSPTLVSAAQKNGLRGFYGAMVVEERRVSRDAMDMRGHDLATIRWTREASTGHLPAPAAGQPPAADIAGPGAPVIGPAPPARAVATPAAGDATGAVDPASRQPSGVDGKIERAGEKIQDWADKAGRKLGGFLDRLGGSGGD